MMENILRFLPDGLKKEFAVLLGWTSNRNIDVLLKDTTKRMKEKGIFFSEKVQKQGQHVLVTVLSPALGFHQKSSVNNGGSTFL